MEEDCIFCKIVKGEMKSYTVYEDELVKGILDAFPVSKGHTLIVPKGHYENIYDIPGEVLSHVTMVTQNLAQKYKTIFNPEGINILQANGKIAGQTVFHYHMHLVPRYSDDGLNLWFHRDSKKEINLEKIFEMIKSTL